MGMGTELITVLLTVSPCFTGSVVTSPVSPGRSPMQLGTDSRWTFLGFS